MATKKDIIKALAIVFIGHFLVDMMIGFWSIYKTLAGLSIAIMGMIAGICPLVGEGMQVFFGTLCDKGYKKILLALGVGVSAVNALIPFSQNYSILFLLYFMTCLSSGAFHPTAVAVATSMTENRKALFVTIFASGGAFGLALSHMIFSSCYLGSKGYLILVMIPSILLMVYIMTARLPQSFYSSAQPGRKHGWQDLKQLFRCPELVFLYLSQVCNQTIYWGLVFLLPDILHSKGYDDWISFGGGHLCLILGGACTMVPGGFVADKYSAKSVLMSSNLFGMVLVYLFLYFSHLPATGVLSLLFAVGAALGVATPIAVAFGNKIMPSRPGLVSSFLMGLVWCISEGIGPGGGGLLTNFFQDDASTKAMAILGLFFFAGIWTVYALPRFVEKTFEIEHA